MNPLSRTRLPIGVIYALAAAALFGAGTPFSKLLLGSVDPWLLAGLLYLGSGCGLSLWLLLGSRLTGRDSREASLKRADIPWLAGAVFFGGVLGPLLLMLGLASTPAASASLLLNLEGVLTALLAWFVFKENFDRRIALGMALITGGGVLLSWSGDTEAGIPWGALGIAGACLAWGIDNNLTRKLHFPLTSTLSPIAVHNSFLLEGCAATAQPSRRKLLCTAMGDNVEVNGKCRSVHTA